MAAMDRRDSHARFDRNLVARRGAAADGTFLDRRAVNPPTFITTSWDDGHPRDLRVAELLTKYGLRGTFYVPAATQRARMTEREVRRLAESFEVGSHTLSHLDLTRTTMERARREIADSKTWIEDNTGRPCRMFCPPRGKYRGRHLKMIREAGYWGLRSVEMCSLDPPRLRAGLIIMPTSVQAHPHRSSAFYRNALKRAAFGNLWRYVVQGPAHHWPKLVEALLRTALAEGGVLHLWGHSWEVDEAGQWRQLDAVLRLLGDAARVALPATNAEICLLGGAARHGAAMTEAEMGMLGKSVPWTSS
jgi:peptidoglycan-N-acetylglucosamine deacetylase